MWFYRLLPILTLCVISANTAIAGPGDFKVVDPEFQFAGSPDPEIADSGAFPFRGPSKCEIALLTNGEISLEARLQTLKNARKSIRIQALIFRGDEVGRRIAEILIQKKKEGLDVRVIVDAFSTITWSTQLMFYDLKQHGIEVEGYEAFYLHWLNEFRFHNPTLMNKRYHDKLWIIDGEMPEAIAIVGGMNIANEYMRTGPKPKHKWRDQDLAVRGAIIQDMVTTFERNYDYLKSIKRRRLIFNTDHFWWMWRKFLGLIGRIKVPYHRKEKVARVYVRNAEIRSASLKLEYQPANARFLQSRPRFEETYIEQAYLDSIQSAQSEILVANAYFVPSPTLIAALQDAARRGVKVTILTNSRETNDLPQLSYVSRYLYLELLNANFDPQTLASGGKVEVYEWQGPKYGESTIHAKFAVFDRLVSIVGSYNLDPRSQNLNSETVLAFENERVSTELAEYFLARDLAKSERISFEKAVEFRFPRRLYDRVMLFLSLRFRGDL